MKYLVGSLASMTVLAFAFTAMAQPPGGSQKGQRSGGGVDQKGGAENQQRGPGGQRGGTPGGGGPGGQRGGPGGAAMDQTASIERMMSLDANQDGALTPQEVADTRLHDLLKRCDVNSDGKVTSAELQTAMAAEVAASSGQGGRGGGGFGDMGGPGGGGPGGGGPGGPGMGGRPGEVLPSFMHDQLQLTDSQRQQLEALQSEVNSRLSQILSQEQQQMLIQGPPGGGPGGMGGRPDQQPQPNSSQRGNRRSGNRLPAD